MIDFTLSRAVARLANVETAIRRTSFQLPVLIAISSPSCEQQVVTTFASAREIFDRIFAILVDRLRQPMSIEKVANLVPEWARLTKSTDSEYVLVLHGKAIFWFSGAATERDAGRRLLLEYARDLAKAEQAPFYRINSRARLARFFVVVLAVAASAAVALLAAQLTTGWGDILQRESAGRTPPVSVWMDAGRRHVARGGNDGALARDASKPTADFTVPAGGWADDGIHVNGAGGESAAPR